MGLDFATRRRDARQIWWSGVCAAQASHCIPPAIDQLSALVPGWQQRSSIVVVGAGKAGAAMAAAAEASLIDHGADLARLSGWLNVPAETACALETLYLHPARPAGMNEPTVAALEGTQRVLDAAAGSHSDALLLCLISGGGSALLVAPARGVCLADKQIVTRQLAACGASIGEMNAVRKHLSRVKGGGLAKAFFQSGVAQRRLVTLAISDVIGDPLDVIASGPTYADPTTFADALAVLDKYDLRLQVPSAARAYLERGATGGEGETLKELPRTPAGEPATVHHVIANNRSALHASRVTAEELGYRSVDLGNDLAGATSVLAAQLMARVAEWRRSSQPLCILSGGETTVTLCPNHGAGGRNQEFALAALTTIGQAQWDDVTVLSGGTDGEDGPTDAAGATADLQTWEAAQRAGLDPATYLACHDAYAFFAGTGTLLKTGWTGTNVMDLRVILIG